MVRTLFRVGVVFALVVAGLQAGSSVPALGAGTFEVSYDANANQPESGVTTGNVPPSSSVASGGNVPVSGNTGGLSRQGFVFDNWNTAADGSGDSYSPEDRITLTEDVTLYAQWSIPGAARLFGQEAGGVRKETIV